MQGDRFRMVQILHKDQFADIPKEIRQTACVVPMGMGDENIRVEARHNFHLGVPEDGKFTSYSFRITAEGKQVIYSGDVRHYSDMGDWLDNCDLLMMETGHHKASEVCAGLRADQAGVRKIMFVHSGREILNDYDGAKARAEAAWGEPVIIAEDGNTYTI